MTVALVALRLASVPWWMPFLAVWGLRVVGSRHTQKRAGDVSQRPGSRQSEVSPNA